jgi:hypothetical protein
MISVNENMFSVAESDMQCMLHFKIMFYPLFQWHTQEFCSPWAGGQQIQLRTEGGEKGNL